jgi:hypothetical protein
VRPTARFALISLLPATVVLYLWLPGARVGALALYVLAPLVVGAQIGWVTGIRTRIGALVGLPLVAIACFLVGWSQYNDDGDSGPLVVLVGVAIPFFVASALAAGLALGANRRRVSEGVATPGGYGVVEIGLSIALAVGLAILAGDFVDIHPAYVLSGLLAAVLLTKTRAWWAGLLVPWGVGVWATFVCLGIRTRETRWLAWAAAYAAPVLLGLRLIALAHGQDARLASVGSMLLGLAWGIGVLHALRIRDEVRLRLAH